MKRIIMFVLLFAALKVAGQTTGYLRFDTVKIMKQNGYCELYVINKTKDSLGLLTNVGGGLTQFKKPRSLSDSTILVGNDTLLVRGTGGAATRFGVEDNLATSDRLIDFNNHSLTMDSLGYFQFTTKTGGSYPLHYGSFFFRNDQISLQSNSYDPSDTRGWGFFASPFLTEMRNAGYTHHGYVQADTTQIILESDPNRIYVNHDSVYVININNGEIDFRVRVLPTSVDTTTVKPVGIGANGRFFKMASWPGAGGGSTPSLQAVTTVGNTSTNDIIVGTRTNSLGRFSVEKTFTALNVHSFDDYSTLNPSSGGFGFGVFDASTTMIGSQTNDHLIAHQSRLTVDGSANIDGAYGLSGMLVYNHHIGSGTVTNAHGILIRNTDGSGPITNQYGLRIEPITHGTNKFAIRSEGGKNSFVDEVMIGAHTTPIAKLDVRNSSYAQTIYCDNTIANGYAAIFNSSNGSGSNVCLDVTASGGTGNKGINFASSMTANDWNIYSSGLSKTYIAGRVGLNITTPVWGLDVQRTMGANKDSITLVSSIGSNSVLLQDTTNGKFQRIDASAFAPVLDAKFTTQGNSGTSETDLYSYTLPANKLAADGRTVNFEIDGEFNDATATAQLKLYFAGNTTLNTGAVNISTAFTAWKLTGYVMRTSSTTAHVTFWLECPGLATAKFLGYSNLTSLDFTTTNIFKVTAQAGGAGGGTSDITAHSWQVTYKPQP